jgi:hypothetical protein
MLLHRYTAYKAIMLGSALVPGRDYVTDTCTTELRVRW